MRRPSSFRLSENSLYQLDELAEALGENRSTIVRIAIDRMHQQEMRRNEMRPETIDVDFEKDVLPILPRWAKNDPRVVLGCRHSLSFRADVFAAKTAQRKRQLKREAQRFEPEMMLDDGSMTMTVGE